MAVPITTRPPRFSFAALAELEAIVTGPVLLPGDPGFDDSTTAFNLAFAHHPDLVVIPGSTRDVVAAVRFAIAHDLPVAVQATGHGFAGHADEGLLLDLSRMDRVTVDPLAETAHVAGGAKWIKVLEAATPHGLAPLMGSTSDVGAVGYTLGGGYGWLGRRYGLSADNVESFELVTADGEVITASAYSNPDLFWALRGGGHGAFGVITGMTIRLVPVSEVYAGNLYYPAEMAVEVMAHWREWIRTAPNDLTSSVALMNFPPVEEVPEPLRGQSFVIVRGAWTGDLDEGERALRYWRDWRAPAIDMWDRMPFALADTISNDPPDPLAAHVFTEWFDDLPEAVIRELPGHLFPEGEQPLVTLIEFRHVGGAVADVPADATAYGNRDALVLSEGIAVVPFPELDGPVRDATAALQAAIQPYATGGRYLNFLEGEARVAHVRAGFTAENWERMTAIKASYDPGNRFRFGNPIPTE